jgi:uncharacterized protein YndB with AHSA1/START domain
MIELGSRTRNLPAPPSAVWEALTDPRRPGARPWLELLPDEVEPTVLAAEAPRSVVWSSLWPSRPDDQVRLELAVSRDGGTALTFTLLSPGEMPDASKLGHLRSRVNRLLFGDLRMSFGQ